MPNELPTKRPRVSMEIWFAILGLFIGLTFVIYRSFNSLRPEIATRELYLQEPASDIRQRSKDNSSTAFETLVLGPAPTVNQAPAPAVQSPESDPLLPPTSPLADAVLAMKYYLLSDASDEVWKLFSALPVESQDLVVRSALYAVWQRGELGHGDWFMGATEDTYTARSTTLLMGDDRVRNTDNADARVQPAESELKVTLAVQRIKLAHKLVQPVSKSTQAYWLPYLVVMLRRLDPDGQANLIAKLVSESNAAVAESLKGYTAEPKDPPWQWIVKGFNLGLPVIFSGIAYILAKISQSALTSIDRWIAARWFGSKTSDEKQS